MKIEYKQMRTSSRKYCDESRERGRNKMLYLERYSLKALSSIKGIPLSKIKLFSYLRSKLVETVPKSNAK